MAYSFIKTGFGGYGGDPTDPKPKTKKVLTDTKTTSVMTDKGIDRIITNTYKTTTTTPGGGKLPYSGSKDFQKAFASARGKGLSTFDWSPTPGVPGSYKKYTTEVYKPRPSATAVNFSTESRTAPGLRFTAGSPNITAKPLLTPKKMNGGGGNPTITERKKKKTPFTPFKWVPEVVEDIGAAFSSLRLFRKGRGRRRGGRGCSFCAKKLFKTMR